MGPKVRQKEASEWQAEDTRQQKQTKEGEKVADGTEDKHLS